MKNAIIAAVLAVVFGVASFRWAVAADDYPQTVVAIWFWVASGVSGLVSMLMVWRALDWLLNR